MKKKIRILVGILTFLVIAITSSNCVWAYSVIEQKALGYGVYKCYDYTKYGSQYIMKANVDIKAGDYLSYDKIILDRGNDNYVKLPNISSLQTVSSSAVSCLNLFTQKNKEFNGLLVGIGFDADTEMQKTANQEDLLTKMGYIRSDGVTEAEGCIRFKVYDPSSKKYILSESKLCAASDKVAKVVNSGTDYNMTGNSWHVVSFSINGSDALKVCIYPFGANGTKCVNDGSSEDYADNGYNYRVKEYNLKSYSSFDNLKKRIKQDVFSVLSSANDGKSVFKTKSDADSSLGTGIYWISDQYIEESGSSVGDMYTIFERRNAASRIAIKNLLGIEIGSESGLIFTSREKYDLYKMYLEDDDLYDVEYTCDPDTVAVASSPWRKVPWYFDGNSMVECAVKPGIYADENLKVHGLDGKNYFTGDDKTFDDLVSGMIEAAGEDDFDAAGIAGNPDSGSVGPGNDPDSSSTVEPSCGNSGAAGSLGWIICPILDGLSEAAENLYNNNVVPLLQVGSNLFSADESTGTLYAWGIFRDIANIAFVILLLVVIFSQLTGIGIDNYGIKKILPKLIIAAVLVNLSYWICLACVDLSNILGNGLQSMFDNLPFGSAQSITITGENGNSVIITAVSGVAILGTLVATGWAVIVNPAILLPILISAIGIVISVFFLFLLLAGREAAIVVLVVIAPLACVCYLLPNTKKFFDRYIKIMSGLLLLYPICGLMVGGSNYASKLLLASGFASQGFVAAFTAMVIGVVPIFFIPTLLKSSFAALGNLGAKISGIGQSLSRGTTGKIKSTEGFKSAQARGYARKTRIKAGLDKNYKPTAVGNFKARVANSRFGRAIGYAGLQRARLASARKDEASMIEGQKELGNLQMEYAHSQNPGSTEDYLTNRLREVADGDDDDAKFAVIDQMVDSNMQASHIAQATRDIFGSRAQDKNFLEKFAKRYGGGFLKKDFEQLDWARKGGIDRTTERGAALIADASAGRRAWRENNMAIDDMKDEDVAALSSDRLHDLIAAGLITRPQAQRVWAANGNMDDTNRLMLGAYGNDDITLTKAEAQAAIRPNGASYVHGLDADSVEAYTQRAAGDVRITDVKWRDSHGKHNQTDPLLTSDFDVPRDRGGSSGGRSGSTPAGSHEDDTSTWD